MARLGEFDLASDNDGANPIDIAISKKKVHESYSPTQYTSDIAVLTLQRSVPYTGETSELILNYTFFNRDGHSQVFLSTNHILETSQAVVG